ncbi:protease TldD [Achromatium sp. WMS1]|nr:protease TldD [Achromatium sp. WMS1]
MIPTDTTAIAYETCLTPNGLNNTDLEQILGQMYDTSIDAADVYFQTQRSESWMLEDHCIKEGNYTIAQGVGIRAISGEKTGFAYSEELTLKQLLKAAKTAKSIAKHESLHSKPIHITSQKPSNLIYQPINPLATIDEATKMDLLQRTDAIVRAKDPRIIQSIVSLAAVYDIILVLDQDGKLQGDVRPLIRLNVQAIAEQQGRREQGFSGGGMRQGLDWFLAEERYRHFAEEAARQALTNLEAKAAPAGTMTVVLGSGWPGILLHEAIGHGLEGDFNRKGTSAFTGRIGERVATPACTVVDDGTLIGRRGSITIDDEGTPSQCTTLIENGILKGYMQDRLNARLTGVNSTGNGRRESYAHLPMPRMTNTYMLPGSYTHEEIIASVTKGIYTANLGGGQVDITSGKFVFSASEAYMIENGSITHPIKGVTLIGNGPDVLTRVSMVGNNLKLDQGVGTCGKNGQGVPVGVGQPTLKIDGLTVGGTTT